MEASVPSAAEANSRPLRLRRLRIALQTRDWVGLCFELMVVTLGVLLAFQIDQWAQDRRQARDEKQFLDRMWSETAAALEETDWIMTLYGRFRQEAVDGYRALEDPALLTLLTGKPNIGCRGSVMPGLGYNTTSFQELSSSGRLSSISDPPIRSALRAVVAAQADAEANRENSIGFAMEGFRMVEPHLIRGLDANDDRTCRVDWLRLARDPSGSVAMARAARLQSLMWMKYAFVHDKLTIAHNRLACKLGKSDCRSTVELILRGPPRTDIIPSEARDDVRRSAELYNGS